MEKREKILVILALFAVLYGIYNFAGKKFVSQIGANFKNAVSKNKINPDPTTKKSIFKIKSSAKNKIIALKLTDHEKYILKQANNVPKKDPFINRYTLKKITSIQDEKKKEDVYTLAKNIHYLGYLSIGDTKMAVINGKEYKKGDQIDESEFVLDKIFPGTVTLKYGTQFISLNISEEQL